jgi:CheY-like chemotaxis protein
MPGETVLVIDDSPTILKHVELVLAKAGYRVVPAPDGEAGIAAAREERPQLVLLDGVLPFMDAEAVCEELLQDEELSDLPVVLMNSGGEQEEGLTALPNVVDSIRKPFGPEALAAVVSHVLETRAPATPTAPLDEADTLGPLPLQPEVPPERPPVAEAPVDAALAGDLAVIPIADVLTLLRDQGHTGTLTLARGDMRLTVFYRAGQVDFATARGVPEEFLLGRFLIEAKQLDAEALAKVIDDRAQATKPPGLLGADLLARGLVSAEGLKQAMALQTAALVFEGLRWGEGRFWFEAHAALPAAAEEAALGLGVDALLLEGFRRVDEWRIIEREVGSFDGIFVRVDDRLVTFGRDRLTREELAVLELVNGKNSVREIVQQSRMGSFDVSKMLYRLLRTKLIRRRVLPVAT